jgi:phenylpropionate dioxygenase-like ring-hydroxylating dioxygenase large terminal subunit
VPNTESISKGKYFSIYPEIRSRKIPLDYYREEYFERERKEIFPKVWLNSGGRGQDIQAAGEFFVLPLPLLNTSLIFCRGEDGTIRGFHNVCSHRGNKLTYAKCGTAKRFICAFHNWTYDTQGKLRGAPGAGSIPDFNRNDYGLSAVTVELWNDFIFFAISPPAKSLKEYLGTWGESVSGFPFDKLKLVSRYRAEVGANWKIMLDAFQEGFHVPFLHHKSQPDAGESENPLALALDITLQGPHGTLSFPANQQSVVYGRGGESQASEITSPATHRLVNWNKEASHEEFEQKYFPPGVNPTRESNWSFDINRVYPNWWLAIRGDHMHTYSFWPVSHDKTIWDVQLYYPVASNVKEHLSQEMRRVRVRNTLPEDLSTVEGTQAVLNSGARDHFVLTDDEILIAHLHHVGDQMLADSNHN